jgi:hypothetical protein
MWMWAILWYILSDSQVIITLFSWIEKNECGFWKDGNLNDCQFKREPWNRRARN